MTLRVILQVVPFGDEDRTYEIGRLDIFNKGCSRWPGFYGYGVIDLGPNPGLYSGGVTHLRSLGAWQLLHDILDELPVEGP